MKTNTYLGDAVYAEKQEWGTVTLYTSDGTDERKQAIHLEPEVLEALNLWIESGFRDDQHPTHA